jgi:hypothetical protein
MRFVGGHLQTGEHVGVRAVSGRLGETKFTVPTLSPKMAHLRPWCDCSVVIVVLLKTCSF